MTDTKVEEILKFRYIGETSRSAYERGVEHFKDLEFTRPKSHMLKHAVIHHPDLEPSRVEFRMKILSSHKTAFERQIREAVLINKHSGVRLMNSKLEYNRCSIPRITVKTGNKEDEKDNQLDMEKMANEKIKQLYEKDSKKRNNDSKKCGQSNKKRKFETTARMDPLFLTQNRSSKESENINLHSNSTHIETTSLTCTPGIKSSVEYNSITCPLLATTKSSNLESNSINYLHLNSQESNSSSFDESKDVDSDIDVHNSKICALGKTKNHNISTIEVNNSKTGDSIKCSLLTTDSSNDESNSIKIESENRNPNPESNSLVRVKLPEIVSRPSRTCSVDRNLNPESNSLVRVTLPEIVSRPSRACSVNNNLNDWNNHIGDKSSQQQDLGKKRISSIEVETEDVVKREVVNNCPISPINYSNYPNESDESNINNLIENDSINSDSEQRHLQSESKSASEQSLTVECESTLSLPVNRIAVNSQKDLNVKAYSNSLHASNELSLGKVNLGIPDLVNSKRVNSPKQIALGKVKSLKETDSKKPKTVNSETVNPDDKTKNCGHIVKFGQNQKCIAMNLVSQAEIGLISSSNKSPLKGKNTSIATPNSAKIRKVQRSKIKYISPKSPKSPSKFKRKVSLKSEQRHLQSESKGKSSMVSRLIQTFETNSTNCVQISQNIMKNEDLSIESIKKGSVRNAYECLMSKRGVSTPPKTPHSTKKIKRLMTRKNTSGQKSLDEWVKK